MTCWRWKIGLEEGSQRSANHPVYSFDGFGDWIDAGLAEASLRMKEAPL